MKPRTVDVLWWNLQRLSRPPGARGARAPSPAIAPGLDSTSYGAQLENVAAVLRHALTPGATGVIGLAGVEGDQTVRDLLRAIGDPLLAAALPRPGQGRRDVVVFYSRRHFQLAAPPEAYAIQNRRHGGELLQVELRTRVGAELVVLANHWPSRALRESDTYRILLADRCSRTLAGLLTHERAGANSGGPSRESVLARWNRRVIVMGDFNDEPFAPSVARILGATRDLSEVDRLPRLPALAEAPARYSGDRPRLYNPTWGLLTGSPAPGTRSRGGEWFPFDQLMVSRGLVVGTGMRYLPGTLAPVIAHGVRTRAGRPVDAVDRDGRPQAFQQESRSGASEHLPLRAQLRLEA